MADNGKTDKTVALLQILGGLGGDKGISGLHIVTVRTAEPDPLTFIMQGTEKALGPDIFEIPVECYPLREGDQLLTVPLVGGMRWVILVKLNGGLAMATMRGPDSLQPDGMAVVYGAEKLVIPPYFVVTAESSTFTDSEGKTSDEYVKARAVAALKSGDRVAIAPTWDAAAEAIKYVVLNRY